MDGNFLQTRLDKIVSEIVLLEDDITNTTNEMKVFETSKQKSIEDFDKDIMKNNEKIQIIQNLIKNEQENENLELKKKEEEKIRLTSYIKEVEDEIVNLKNKDLEKAKEKEMLEKKFFEKNKFGKYDFEEIEKKRQDQEKEAIETAKKNLEIKKNMINIEIQKLSEMQNTLQENMDNINNKKEIYESELVNLISQKETLEELIKNFCITKKINSEQIDNLNNLTNSPNETRENDNRQFYLSTSGSLNNLNVTNIRNCEIALKEFSCIDKNRVGKAIYDNFFEVDTSMMLIDKQNFEKNIKNSFESFTESKGIFSSDDIILLITKKIFDIFADNKKFNENNPFSSERVRNFLKYFLKIQYYESLIKEKFGFVHEEYSKSIKNIDSQISEISNKITQYNNQLEKLTFKQKSILLDSPSKDRELFDDFSHKSPYIKAVGKLDSKLLELIELKNDLDIQMIKMKTNISEKIEDYRAQIKQIENTISEFRAKKMLLPFEIENNRVRNNEKIITIRGCIAEKFQLIKEIFKTSENNSNHNNLVESCIDKIRRSVNDLRRSAEISPEKAQNLNNSLNFINSNSSNFYNPNLNRSLSSNYNNVKNSSGNINTNLNQNGNPNHLSNLNQNLGQDSHDSCNSRIDKHDYGIIPYSTAIQNSNKKQSKEEIFGDSKATLKNLNNPQHFNTPMSDNINSMNQKFYSKLEDEYLNRRSYKNSFILSKNEEKNFIGQTGRSSQNTNYASGNLNSNSELNYNNSQNLFDNKQINQSFHTCREPFVNSEKESNFPFFEKNNSNFDFNNYTNTPNSPRRERYERMNIDHHRPQLSIIPGKYDEFHAEINNPNSENFYSNYHLKEMNYNPQYEEFYSKNQNNYNCEYPAKYNLYGNFHGHNCRSKNSSLHSLSSLRKNFAKGNFENDANLNYTINNKESCRTCESCAMSKRKKNNRSSRSPIPRYIENSQFSCESDDENKEYYLENLEFCEENADNLEKEKKCGNCEKQKKNIEKYKKIIRNKSSDLSYLNEKYEKNKKNFEETKQKIGDNNTLKKTKSIFDSKETTQNLNKNHHKIKTSIKSGNNIGKSKANISILSEKEILNNSINNLKNEIIKTGEIDKIEKKIREQLADDKKNKNETAKLRKSLRNSTEKNLKSMSTLGDDYMENHTASIISSTVANPFLKETSEKKLHMKMLQDYLSEKLMKGEIAQKMQPLIKGSFGYRRFISKSDKKTEINTLNIENPEDFGFNKFFMYLDNELMNLIFYKKDPFNIIKETTEISTIRMEKTLVSKLTKNIISVHQFYRSLVKQKIDPDKYFEENKGKFINESSRLKYLMNKNFMLTIKLKDEERIEIIFISYIDFKMWLNGLAILIKTINDHLSEK